MVGEVDDTQDEDSQVNMHFIRRPFRRSPLWTTARVMLQLLLVNTLDECTAMLLYKLVILRFLSTYIEEALIEQIDTDTAMQMITKIARRLHKVDCLLQSSKHVA